MSDYKYVRVDLLKEEIEKECVGCLYENTNFCLSCRVPDFKALVDIVYESQEHESKSVGRRGTTKTEGYADDGGLMPATY